MIQLICLSIASAMVAICFAALGGAFGPYVPFTGFMAAAVIGLLSTGGYWLADQRCSSASSRT